MLLLVILLGIGATTAAEYDYVFRQVAVRYDLIGVNGSTSTAASLEDCGNTAYTSTKKILALQFTFSNKTCKIYPYVQCYKLTNATVQETGEQDFVWYVRDGGSCTTCMPTARTESMIAQITYQKDVCVNRFGFAYDKSTGYCSALVCSSTLFPFTVMLQCANQNTGGKNNTYGDQYSFYRIGARSDGMCYVMTRAQVLGATKYSCTSGTTAFPIYYNSTYYCFTNYNSGVTNSTVITKNYCKNALSGGYPSKILHSLFYGLLSIQTSGNGIFGIYYTGSTYAYYDGTKPATVNWKDGYPTYTRSNVFVRIDTELLTLYDTNTNGGKITCLSAPISR